MASPIPSPPPEPATDGDDAQPQPPPRRPPPPTPHPATDPPPISPQNPTPPPPPPPPPPLHAAAAEAVAPTTPSPNHSGDPSRPIPSQAPAPPPPPTADPSPPPLPHDNRTPQLRAAPPPAPAPPAPPSPPPSLPPSPPPAPGSPESMLEREASEADGGPENMTLALALAETETEKAMPPTPPKVAEAAESPTGSPQKESALTIAKLLSGEDHAGTETKPVPEKAAPAATTTAAAAASVGGGSGGGGVGSKRWLLGGVPEKVRRSELRRAELGFRVLAAVFCLVSLSVMAADATPGWSGDSFRRYNEYRYTLSASVLAFTYSGFQLVVEVHYFVTGRRIIRDPSGKYFNLAMDQVLAYLLLSASSAALSRNDVWVSRFGVDQFAKLINASASMAFLAFVALGFSSIISAYHVFSSVF